VPIPGTRCAEVRWTKWWAVISVARMLELGPEASGSVESYAQPAAFLPETLEWDGIAGAVSTRVRGALVFVVG